MNVSKLQNRFLQKHLLNFFLSFIKVFLISYLGTARFKNKKVIKGLEMFLASFLHAEEAFVT